jgi:hypothetical protein
VALNAFRDCLVRTSANHKIFWYFSEYAENSCYSYLKYACIPPRVEFCLLAQIEETKIGQKKMKLAAAFLVFVLALAALADADSVSGDFNAKEFLLGYTPTNTSKSLINLKSEQSNLWCASTVIGNWSSTAARQLPPLPLVPRLPPLYTEAQGLEKSTGNR